MLVHHIESKLYARQGKAVTNFALTLPAPQSDLAQELLKDPYNFDFLTLGSEAEERDLEKGLLEHIRKFLLELGLALRQEGPERLLITPAIGVMNTNKATTAMIIALTTLCSPL